MTETPVIKSDLGVRTASAVVMVAVAGTALWLGGWVWTAFVALVAITCLAEFIRLIFKSTVSPTNRTGAAIGALFYVLIPASTLAWMRLPWVDDKGGWTGVLPIIAVLGVVVCTDIGAYFAGRTIGGPKIAPKISPSKTWAGLAGGMIAAGLWSILAQVIFTVSINLDFDFAAFHMTMIRPTSALGGAILAVIAQAGDFFESWLKRRAGVKDSSNLIPGHGGVFDRVDGLLPVVIAYGVFWIRPF